MSPDPLKGGIANPQSLNRYTYVLNNPCNLIDPMGLCDVVAGGFTDTPNNVPDLTAFANNIHADTAFPYSVNANKILGAVESFFLSDGSLASEVLTNAIMNAYSQTDTANGDKVNLFLFSGAAQTFANVYSSLPTDVQKSIGNVTYLSPGTTTAAELPTGTGRTNMYSGKNYWENMITDTARPEAFAAGIRMHRYPDPSCQSHSNACAFNPMNKLGQYKGSDCSSPTQFTRQNPTGSGQSGSSSDPNGSNWDPIYAQEWYMMLMYQLQEESASGTGSLVGGYSSACLVAPYPGVPCVPVN